MKIKILAIILSLVTVFGITGCNISVNLPSVEDNNNYKQYEDKNIMLCEKPRKIAIHRNYAELNQDKHYGGSFPFGTGYLCVTYNETGLNKVSIYSLDGDLPYTKIEITNLQEGSTLSFDLIATRDNDLKEYYSYMYDNTTMTEDFETVGSVVFNNTIEIERIDANSFKHIFNNIALANPYALA